jgi:hypothetical protein
MGREHVWKRRIHSAIVEEETYLPRAGEVRERLNRAVSKTVEPLRVPWVRIPPSPPGYLRAPFFFLGSPGTKDPVSPEFLLDVHPPAIRVRARLPIVPPVITWGGQFSSSANPLTHRQSVQLIPHRRSPANQLLPMPEQLPHIPLNG